jgi:TPR repeat protein
MRTHSRAALGAFVVLIVIAPVAVGADDMPPFTSASDAYRQGRAAMKAGHFADALPNLVYAAQHGVLGAQLKLARLYAQDGTVAKDDAKAFSYYQQIADQRADTNPDSPIAPYVAEAFVALGRYYQQGLPQISLAADPLRAAGLYRHAASYFGDPEAQYLLARLYLEGDGVEKDVPLAASWLAIAARKQYVAAQATLGELLWRGEEVPAHQARGFALIMLAHHNAAATGKEPDWIAKLYREAEAAADNETRKEARTIIPELGGALTATTPPEAQPARATEKTLTLPPSGEAVKVIKPTASSTSPPLTDADDNTHRPAALDMPLGFATSSVGLRP